MPVTQAFLPVSGFSVPSALCDNRSEAVGMKHNPGFLKLVNDAKSRVREIDIAGYRKMVADKEPHLLIDTREESEWSAGHAQSAIH